jgi:hypothetical protein
MKPKSPPTMERDLRIDFFRGVALLVVLVDHIEAVHGISFIRNWTPQSLGFSDAAEAFVFLSGYTYGMVYDRYMDRHGFWSTLRKSVIRSAQIYFSGLITLIIVVLVGYGTQSIVPQMIAQLHLYETVPQQIFKALFLSNQPIGFEILAFYVVMLPFAAVLIRLHHYIAWTVSVGLYAVVQFLPSFNLPHFHSSLRWYFNPFGWQFLYLIGIAAGTKCLTLPESRWTRGMLCSLAMGVVLLGLIHAKGTALLGENLSPMFLEDIRKSPMLTEKTSLGPLRLLHCLSVVILLSVAFEKRGRSFPGLAKWCAIVPGQHSLFFYCFGVVLAYCSIPIFAVCGVSNDIALIIVLDMVILSILTVNMIHRRRATKSSGADLNTLPGSPI